MSRDIKFKVWNKRLARMFRVYTLNFDVDLIQCESESKAGHTFGFIDCCLMQYTGLKDKNGKEIYEGDIYQQGDQNIRYKVIFNDCQFVGSQIGNKSLAGLTYFSDCIEVIGNIYENSDLLDQ